MLSIYAKEKSFLLEDAGNVPRNDEDATKCSNARTRSGESNGTVEMVNRNK